jgi:endonuclease-3
MPGGGRRFASARATNLAIPNGVTEVPMATTINKQRLLNQLFATARRTVDSGPEARPVLQQFIYGLCRENATPEQADRAYQYLCQRFFDWNEVRVSSTRELEEAFEGMADAEGRAQRLVVFLQEVFETTFSFDLESLSKKGLKQAAKQLSRYQAANDYIGGWVVQRSLGGHAIPVDAPTLRCARRLGLAESGAEEAEVRASLEHLVPKAKGPLFTDVVSFVAHEYCWEDEPQCPSCPLAGECATGHEMSAEPVVARGHRPKPR